jgi:hypothetical protein
MPGQVRAATKVARRAAPVVLEAYRRWERLTPAEKERYKKQVRQAGEKARDAVVKAGKRVRHPRR